MKNLMYTFATLFAIAFTAQARIITVNNISGGEYNRLDSAYANAANGDTIYLEATDVDYGFITLNKSLTLVGIGFNPNTQDGKRSRLDYIDLDTGASGSSFYGLFLNRISNFPSQGPVSDILIQNCNVEQLIFQFKPMVNVIIRNSILVHGGLTSLIIYNATSAAEQSTYQIFNCFINHEGIEGHGSSYNSVTLDHCIFAGFNALRGIKNAYIKNSIFDYNSFPSSSGNVFENNIIISGGDVGVGNTSTGNLFNTSPLFVSYGWRQGYDQTKDFALLPASPGKNAATDGTDIGIHGGNAHFSETGETLWLPIVRSFNFQGATVPNVQPGDTLQLQIKASRPAVD